MREIPADIHGTTSSETKTQKKKKTEGVLLSVLTETLEQLESVLDSEAAERIYIDSNIVQDLFEDARLQHLCKK